MSVSIAAEKWMYRIGLKFFNDIFMKKKEIKSFVALAFLCITVYPFVLIYQQIGIAGFIILAGIALGFFLYNRSRSKKQESEVFSKFVIDVLFCRIPPLEIGKITGRLYKSNFPRGALVRNIQIIGESISIALKSKKREVAESRIESVLACFEDIKVNQTHLISYETFETIAKTVKEAIKEANTAIYINIASGHLNKIHKLKTIKSKNKYFELAKAILDEGLNNEQSDKTKIETLLNDVLKIEKSMSQVNT